MYISNPRHQYSPIEQSVNRLIDQLIYLSTDARNGWMDTSVGQQIEGRIDRTYRKEASTGRTVAITDRTQSQESQLSQSQEFHLSIFHSINGRIHCQKGVFTEREAHQKDRADALIGGADRRDRHINRTGGSENKDGGGRNTRQNTIPTIPDINISIHQQRAALIDKSIYRKG